MITLKDYAEKHSISYEAVRQQVDRYKDDLQEHISKQGKTRYLDEEAEAFLDAKRATNPIVIIDNSKDDRIEELEGQCEALKVKVMQLQEQIISRDDKILELTDKVLLLAAKPEPEVEPKKWWQFWK